jgi:hypothetical protein
MKNQMGSRSLWEKHHTWEVACIYGTLIFLGLTAYFLTMYAVGAVHNVSLRFLNLIILLIGCYFAVKQYKRTHLGHISYFRTLTVGVATSSIASSTFALFMLFMLQTDNSLMRAIQQNEQMGPYMNPFIASFMVMLEGVFSGLAVAYLYSNYMSNDKANEPMGGTIPVTDKDGHFHSELQRS